MCLAPGLVAFSTVNMLARAFYALGDTKTPMKISIVCLAVNLILAAALVVPLRQGGLGIANTAHFHLQRLAAGLRAAEKAGETGNGIAARDLSAAGRRRHCWPDCWRLVRLAILGKFVRPPTIALKIGAVFVPAGIAGLVYWLVGAGVQNSGGERKWRSLRWRDSKNRARGSKRMACRRRIFWDADTASLPTVKPAPRRSSSFVRTSI
jgi:hypothetical protein